MYYCRLNHWQDWGKANFLNSLLNVLHTHPFNFPGLIFIPFITLFPFLYQLWDAFRKAGGLWIIEYQCNDSWAAFYSSKSFAALCPILRDPVFDDLSLIKLIGLVKLKGKKSIVSIHQHYVPGIGSLPLACLWLPHRSSLHHHSRPLSIGPHDIPSQAPSPPNNSLFLHISWQIHTSYV